MKRTLLLLIAVAAITARLFATTWTIQVSNYQFSNAALTGVHTGDTVKWQWVNGAHTTTSTSIPAGAAAWDQVLDNTVQTFIYVPTVAGTYNYQCTPHASGGMTASFAVTTATDVDHITGSGSFSLYPNPAINSVHVDLSTMKGSVQMTIVDIAGQVVENRNLVGGSSTEVSVAHLANGAYTLQAMSKGLTITERFTIAH